jgi:hypothetical protein
MCRPARAGADVFFDYATQTVTQRSFCVDPLEMCYNAVNVPWLAVPIRSVRFECKGEDGCLAANTGGGMAHCLNAG